MITDKQILDAKILIVDDERENVVVLGKILQIEGYKYLENTTDPREAKKIYEDFLPDLVILDLKMPYLDGFQVLEQLQSARQDSYLPVMVISAQQDEESILRALDEGAKDFIIKPYNSTEVIVRIRNLVEVRLLNEELKNQNQILEDRVRDRTKELNETQKEIVRRLGIAAEYRDNETGLHITRMSKMCHQLGKAIGMSKDQTDLLLNASSMHDIGKIGIPDRILLKPGKLDPNEWEKMKTHTTIGSNLLSKHKSELMGMARVIAVSHHEKWDGSGYPNGLKGEDIPIVGRIAAVCDVFDALTSKRPYKNGWSIDDSLAEIYRNSGKHFDPNLVEAFKKILPNILEISRKYAEPENRTDN